MERARQIFLWAVLPLGIVWNVWGYMSMAAQWGDANLTYGRFISEGGFWTLLIPVVLWLCLYFRAYFTLLFSIVVVVMAMGWSAWY